MRSRAEIETTVKKCREQGFVQTIIYYETQIELLLDIRDLLSK